MDEPRDGEQDTPRRDLKDTPEVGLIDDEDLPEDLRPTDDNPLAQDPDDSGDDEDPSEAKVDGMPDMGQPGPPA